MKRFLSLLAILLILVPVVAACSDSSSTKEAEGDKVVIDFFHRWPNEPRKSFYDEKIKEFEAAHPNVKINVDAVLNDSYKEKIRVLVSNDDLPDVFTSWSDSFAMNLVSSERIMALDEIINEDTEWSGKIIESQFSGFTFDDKTYGIPFTIDGKAFFYNTKIFEEHNLKAPTTYDELIDVLDALQAAGYETPLVEGLTNGWAISHYLGTIFQRVLDPAVTATDYVDGSGEFTDPGYIRGLEIFKELTSYMGDVSTAIDHEAARNMFGNEEAPIVYMQFAEIKMVEEMGLTDIGFFDFPAIEGGKGDSKALTGAPEGWMLSKNAPKEAVEFLKFLTSEETAYDFTKTDGQLNAIKGAVDAENSSETSMAAYDIVLNASATAPWFDNAVNINIADIFMRGGQSLATGDATPEDIMKEVQAEAAKLK
ncbi:ABC transporter substrate-binding protein [Fredinandcohnia onubensis]|uniref:ABC transporter substrate-binding protein n=1 Tax=Fredinandcohnia onubensis TaxID=1571209 RepID=UPI000C0C091C|nr:extracellular solute-binding protein [Fredinandcohnia onubensis]